MKNLAKVLVMTLLVGLFGVVAVSSLLATPSVQTPLVATTSYNVATGIRWNEGFGAFEVFNTSGISYIASGEYFDASGTKGVEGAGFVKADGTKTYNIMQDIAYNPSDVANIETNFAGGTRHSITTGAVNGRGFILKNFPIIATETAGTALFRSNQGTIQNLILENPIYSTGTANTGILVYENTGVIDGCEITGTINTENAISIASMAYLGSGTIRNCVNKLNITTNGRFVAGLVADARNLNLVSNRNFGSIKSDAANSFAGGIAAVMTMGEALDNANYASITANDAGGILGTCSVTTVKGNKNLGNITGDNTACGIVGGEVFTLDHSGNTNNGNVKADQTAQIYLGEDDTITLPEHIYYVPSVIPNSPAVFMIDSMTGLSYIGSGTYFDNLGAITNSEDPNSAPASSDNTIYIITKDIEYSAVEGRDNPLVIGEGSLVEGQDHKLTNFPIRQIGETANYVALFESIASTATVRNLTLHTNTTEPGGSTEDMLNVGILSYINDGKVENCTVEGEINTTLKRNIGGIAYTNSATHSTEFINCTNKVNVATGAGYLGGIIAYSVSSIEMKITGCTNTGELSISGTIAAKCLGGIAGLVNRATVSDCHNFAKLAMYGDATSGGDAADVGLGGIVGRTNEHITIIGCSNNNGLESEYTATMETGGTGGIIGYVGVAAAIIDCKNSSSGDLFLLGGGWNIRLGGIVGVLKGNKNVVFDNVYSRTAPSLVLGRVAGSVLLNCINSGDIISNRWYVTNAILLGGIVAEVHGCSGGKDLLIEACQNYGAFNFEDFDTHGYEMRNVVVGGLVGIVIERALGTVMTLKDSSNYSSIITSIAGTAYGGLVGFLYEGNISLAILGCVNDGDISCSKMNLNNMGMAVGLSSIGSQEGLTCSGLGVVDSGRFVGSVESSTMSDAPTVATYVSKLDACFGTLPPDADSLDYATHSAAVAQLRAEYEAIVALNLATPNQFVADVLKGVTFAPLQGKNTADLLALIEAYEAKIAELSGVI